MDKKNKKDVKMYYFAFNHDHHRGKILCYICLKSLFYEIRHVRIKNSFIKFCGEAKLLVLVNMGNIYDTKFCICATYYISLLQRKRFQLNADFAESILQQQLYN